MRLVFVVLVVMNGLLFGWQLLRPAEEPSVAVASAPAAGTAARSLIIIDEMDTDAREVLAKASAKPASSSAPICTLAGPFVDADRGAIVRERLRALGVESNLQSLEITAGESYWVYLPPESSQEQALRRLHELQAKQVDSYVIPKGELANGISFGMFTQKPLAEARKQEMERLGYSAQIRILPRTQKEMWLVLGPGQALRVGDAVWSELLPEDGGQEIRQNLCSAVASGDKFH
ncbi:SPOR domain-containing protein [Simiduia aestuariiviva]|uniref:SPOR domain-containing protein n=1 Tax=Simiduia aestuariiviva TaxID=1510459 RepID=A0A839UTX6_9GAMM|nr:SPOR domain-containing protein [Simiduia aestuariiviva]MBB3170171.1 hypothetical protein [Simiduia aestuariiviva]